jgi:thiol-disulfide isomerase/thioredoxin
MSVLWPTDFVWKEPLAEPSMWGKPGVVMFFNLECPGCVSRGLPFLKRLYQEHVEALTIMLIHTAFGHKHYPRDEVVPTLQHFAKSFAKLPFPIALDLDGKLAEHYQAAGTPHWLVFNQQGELIKSMFGSQENTQTRLEYVLEEVGKPLAG